MATERIGIAGPLAHWKVSWRTDGAGRSAPGPVVAGPCSCVKRSRLDLDGVLWSDLAGLDVREGLRRGGLRVVRDDLVERPEADAVVRRVEGVVAGLEGAEA